MNQQISAVTIAVNSLKLLKSFYHEVLGWKILAENDKVVPLKIGETVLTLCSIDRFTEYSGAHPGDIAHKTFYFTINLDSPKQVDIYFKKIGEKKIHITKSPEKTFWGGYSGFFTDPEGNIWEVCYNPVPGKNI